MEIWKSIKPRVQEAIFSFRVHCKQILGLDNDSDYDIEMDPDYDIGSKTSRDPIIVPMPDISAMVLLNSIKFNNY